MHTNPTSFLKSKLLLVYCSIFLLVIAALYGCKKTDSIYTPQSNTGSTAARFFNIPAATSPAVKRIAAEIQRRNTQKEFITAFAKSNGYPVWDKPLTYDKNVAANTQSVETGNGIPDTTIVIIPLVLENTFYVNAYIQASMVDTSITQIQYNVAAAYSSLSSTGNELIEIPANRYAIKYFLLNKEVFGYTKFKLLDSTLLKLPNQQSGHFERNIELLPAITNESNTGSSCYTLVITWNCSICGKALGECTFGGGGSASYYLCSPLSGDDWGDSGGGATTPGGGTPGGHGAGGGGGLSPQYPCPNNPNQNCPPPTGPIGWEPLDDNETPCNKMKPIKAQLDSNQVIQSLWGFMNNPDPAFKREFGVKVTQPSAMLQAGPPIIGDKLASVIFSLQPGLQGLIHTHPNVSDKILPIFSPEDILMTYHTLAAYSNGTPVTSYTQFFTSVLNWKGDSYFMVIDDIDAFKAFAKRLDFDNFPTQNDELEQKYKLHNITHNSSVQDTEKNFLQFLQNNNCGVKLLKSDQNFTQFSELSLNGQKVVAKACP